MLQQAQFSVYNSLRTKPPARRSPLADLLPDNCEHGWHVARNPIKPLNHLAFLRRKEEIAVELQLHNRQTSPGCFQENYVLLSRHQAGQISTAEVVDHLVRQLRDAGKPLSQTEVARKLREYATIRHMEFHPSDVCNLTCRDCTYGHDDPERKPPPINYPFQEIWKIAKMKPRSAERSLYRRSKEAPMRSVWLPPVSCQLYV